MGVEIAVYLGAVVVIAVVGIRIGMLVAPGLERLATTGDDDPAPGGDEGSGDDDRLHD